ncbi:dCTP deaminase [Methanospirillum sp.]|uniref:dCTP deaminase n=1 Tax=Methanospirillum sp. TaxID=45200 RepID=UPI0029841701|nr:dCTP deaminase [Methanospirillum sp.]
MILSSRSIKTLLTVPPEDGGIIINPYAEESQQPASYDLRASEPAIINKNMMTLLASKEWIELPVDIAATLRCRSSYARRGIFISGGFVDPGFRGHLTLCLYNCGSDNVSVLEGDRIIQMVFQQVDLPGEGYSGRYQDSHGVVTAR